MFTKLAAYLASILVAAILLITVGFIFKAANKYHKEVPLTNEKELKVTLDAGLGNIALSKGNSNLILNADVEADLSSDITEYFDYSARDRVGYLNINTTEECDKASSEGHRDHSIHFHGFESSMWNLRFANAIPISFDIELGLGKGTLDFTGLSVKDLNLSTGASAVSVNFDKPNTSLIEDMTIESGLSKFTGTGLCNANFNHFKFQGGVGSYWLDFGGNLDREVDVDIEVGVGSLTVVIPHNIGAKIIYEKSFVAHIELARDFSEEQEHSYFSSNYNSASGKMNIRIEAGLGSVKVKRQ